MLTSKSFAGHYNRQKINSKQHAALMNLTYFCAQQYLDSTIQFVSFIMRCTGFLLKDNFR